MKPTNTFAKYKEKQAMIQKRRQVALDAKFRKRKTSSRSWSGDLTGTHVGKFLKRELNIDVNLLSLDQQKQLERDIIYMSLDNRTEIRDQAKVDSKIVESVLKKLYSIQSEVQDLSPDFWLQKGQGIKSHPAFALLELQAKLEAHLHLAKLESGILGTNKQNLTSRALCLSAIDTFLRWYDDDRSAGERGITYPEDVSNLLKISKVPGQGDRSDPSSKLAEFLDICTEDLGKVLQHWRFDYWDPSREAKAKFEASYLPDILAN